MAQAFGYTPRETDSLHIRDLAVMLHAAVRKQRTGWQQAAVITAKIHNMGGPRGQSFSAEAPADLFPELFSDVAKSDEEWRKEVEAQFEQYNPE